MVGYALRQATVNRQSPIAYRLSTAAIRFPSRVAKHDRRLTSRPDLSNHPWLSAIGDRLFPQGVTLNSIGSPEAESRDSQSM